jgi:hypothetical protein
MLVGLAGVWGSNSREMAGNSRAGVLISICMGAVSSSAGVHAGAGSHMVSEPACASACSGP